MVVPRSESCDLNATLYMRYLVSWAFMFRSDIEKYTLRAFV